MRLWLDVKSRSRRIFIRSSTITLVQRARGNQQKGISRVLRRFFGRSRKRLVRIGLLALNFAILAAVVMLVTNGQLSGAESTQNSVISESSTAPTSPLDQLSSADIASHVAHITNLPEVRSVDNHADTFNAQLTTAPSSDKAIVAKPQAIAEAPKTRKDIFTYTVQPGETVTAIAQKFNVSSDSVRWSNGLNGDTVAAGKVLNIPPRNGIVYTVKQGDTLDSLAQKYSANRDALSESNDAEIAGLWVGEQILIPDGVLPVTRSTSTYSSSFAWGGYTAVYSSNGYDYGWCTWWAAKRRADVGRPIPSNLGNAITWAVLAQRAGLPVNGVPEAGAVAYYRTIGGLGHVGFVERVNDDGSVWISDMNYYGVSQIDGSVPAGGWGRASYHLVGADGLGAYLFIH